MEGSTAHVLVVWDFDWSLMEENSDTWVVHVIGADAAFHGLKAQGLPWTQLMDATLRAAHQTLGLAASEAAVRAAARSVPFHPDLLQVARVMSQREWCDMVILSDANSVFIAEILAAHSVQSCFREVVTNPAAFEGGALRVRPYHRTPHGCPRCPANLCKGLVIDRLMLGNAYSHVIYVGDGRGDYCPATRLAESDVVLARSHYPDGSECSLSSLLHASAANFARFSSQLCRSSRSGANDGRGHCIGFKGCGCNFECVWNDTAGGLCKEVQHRLTEVGAEAGNTTSAGSEALPETLQVETLLPPCGEGHDEMDSTVERKVFPLKEGGTRSESPTEGFAAPAQVLGIMRPEVSVAPPAAAHAGRQSKGRVSRRDVSATVFSWRKPEDAAALLRSLCTETGLLQCRESRVEENFS